MKNALILLALLTCSSTFAEKFVNERNIPQNISFVFHYHFPGAGSVAWHRHDQNYKASYQESGKKIEVYFDSQGDCVEIDREISVEEIPTEYKTWIASQLGSDPGITNITSIDDFSEMPFYLIEVVQNNKTYTFELPAAKGNEQTRYQLRQGTVIW